MQLCLEDTFGLQKKKMSTVYWIFAVMILTYVTEIFQIEGVSNV
jgi:hypothetical protein